MKNILVPTGYMSSGSSAVTDLLSEFDDYYADFGTHEYVFLHCPNGVFDLEDKLLVGNNAIRSDEALHSFKATMDQLYDKKYWWVGHYKDTFGVPFQEYTNDYIDSLITLKTDQYWYQQENTNFKMGVILAKNRILKLLSFNKYIGKKPLLYPQMWMSLVTPEEFYEKTRQYLNQLFLMIGLDKRNLILDQFLLPFNLHRYDNYFDSNVKVVVVARDPRDVYFLNKYKHRAMNESVPFPTNAEDFCNYYKRMRQSEKIVNNDQILRINFEDLIYKYDETVQDIMNLLELSEADHIRKKQKFNPDKSIENTQIYLNRPEFAEELAIIERELGDYLYDFPYEREANFDKTF
ncbi:MAG: sulfotransferase domain-containing protein [Erysipelothrix sp.]